MSKRGKQRNHTPLARRLSAEVLEQRLLLDGDGVLLGSDARFTLSFALDGTRVASEESALFEQMDAIADRDVWQAAILKGVQTWAQHTNGDVGLVADDGSPIGSDGAIRGDTRFGDIRIGSIPLDEGLIATSISTLEVVDGTWVGDILFNSEYEYENIDQVFAVALHEAGHVFGLDHNDDPNSPMFSHEIPTSTVPTSGDIAGLQANFGPRAQDVFDSEDPGVVDVPNFRLPDQAEGSAPSLLFADIQSTLDSDVYEVRVPSGYDGSMTVEIITSGISQLSSDLTVTSPSGDGMTITSGPGQDGSLTLNHVTANGHYTIEVASGSSDAFGVGGYTLVVWYDDINQIDANSLEDLVRYPTRFIELDDFEEYFEEGEELFANDDDGNDDVNGLELDTIPGFLDGSRYRIQASIETVVDRDRYVLESPEDALPGARDWAQLTLRGLDNETSSYAANVWDESGNLIATNTVISNDTMLVVQFPYVLDQDYVAEVYGRNGQVGNYSFETVFGTAEIVREKFVGGNLTAAQDANSHGLQLDRAQLFHFNLSSIGKAAAGTKLRMKIVNRRGKQIALLESLVGETETTSLFLPKGQYRIVVDTDTTGPGMGPIQYSIGGSAIDDPLGPRIDNPANDPFAFGEDDFFVPHLAFAFSIRN